MCQKEVGYPSPGTKHLSLYPSVPDSDEPEFQTQIIRVGFGARTGPVDQRAVLSRGRAVILATSVLVQNTENFRTSLRGEFCA